MQTDELAAGVLCLRAGGEPADWFLDQVHALGAVEWGPDGDPADDEWLAQATAAITRDAAGGPVHVLASGTAVPRALLLAARHPELVVSVLAADPEVDEADPAYWELLREVQTPTLVVVAAPEADTDTSQAQTVAGGVTNGVMVIVDGTAAPVHRSNPRSFAEWVTAFMSIAEGLSSLVPQAREEAHA
jgi:pimeloyl-ACP methyl ester carboxylesterase